MRVVVLTNSLAATDVSAVHAGYSRYRKALLEAGVELYEIKSTARRPDDDKKRGEWLASGPMDPRVGGKVALRALVSDTPAAS